MQKNRESESVADKDAKDNKEDESESGGDQDTSKNLGLVCDGIRPTEYSLEETIRLQKRETEKKLLEYLKKEENYQEPGCMSSYTIPTSSAWYQIWKAVIIILSFLSCFIYAFSAAFLHRMTEEAVQVFYIQEQIFQIVFCTNMLISCMTQHHYKTTDSVEKDVAKIFVIYAKGRLIIDIISVVPIESIFQDLLAIETRRLLYLLKLVRLSNGFEMISY